MLPGPGGFSGCNSPDWDMSRAALDNPKPLRAHLDRRYLEHEERPNDGVNRLAVRFAREGVEGVAGWRRRAGRRPC